MCRKPLTLRFRCLYVAIVSLCITSGITAQSGSVLVGNWKMNEGSGNTLVDNTGNGNDATLQNSRDIEWVAGKEDLAISLPGTKSRFGTAPNQPSLNITDKLTIAAWIRPSEVRNCTVLSKCGSDGYELAISSTGKIEFRFNSDTYGTTYRIFSNTAYPADGVTWMHVAATYDGIASKIYINGNLDVEVYFTVPVPIISNTSPLYIGSLLDDRRWRGALDDVRLYHGALTASEIGPLAGITAPAAPVLVSPANLSTNILHNTTVTWNAVTGATKYRLEVSQNANFATTFLAQDDITASSFTLSNLLPTTVYYWRVRAANNGGSGNWSSVWSFTTATLSLPAAPILAAPANASIDAPLNQVLSWNEVPGATKYRAEVSLNSNFTTTVVAQDNIVPTSLQLANLSSNTTYYWRIRATNTAGDGNWSAVWNFKTIPPPTTSGFVSLTPISPVTVAGHTADKPQAKIWKYANKWWTVLSTPGGTKVFRLDGTTWTDILTISTSNSTKADCWAVGDVTHVLLYRSSNPSYLLSIQYDQNTGTYKLWNQRQSRVDIVLEAGTETAVMCVDGNGRMWVANAGVSEVYVRWSDAPYNYFSSPIVVAQGIADDDICAITALPGKIGLLWSNQNTQRFGFKTHVDGAAPGTWSNDEVPASQSALNVKNGMADDHICMIAGSNGTVYCSVKTGYDTKGYPQVGLLVRRPAGTWDNLYQVSDSGSRPMVILNQALGKVKVVYTTTGNRRYIVYREASTSDFVFSKAKTLIGDDGRSYDYSSSTHQLYDSEIVILATDQTTSPRTAVAVIASDVATVSGGSQPAPATLISKKLPVEQNFELTFSPNPVHDQINLNIRSAYKGKVMVSITDAVGRTYSRSNYVFDDASYKIDLTGKNLKPGIYFLELKSDDFVRVIKFYKN